MYFKELNFINVVMHTISCTNATMQVALNFLKIQHLLESIEIHMDKEIQYPNICALFAIRDF